MSQEKQPSNLVSDSAKKHLLTYNCYFTEKLQEHLRCYSGKNVHVEQSIPKIQSGLSWDSFIYSKPLFFAECKHHQLVNLSVIGFLQAEVKTITAIDRELAILLTEMMTGVSCTKKNLRDTWKTVWQELFLCMHHLCASERGKSYDGKPEVINMTSYFHRCHGQYLTYRTSELVAALRKQRGQETNEPELNDEYLTVSSFRVTLSNNISGYIYHIFPTYFLNLVLGTFLAKPMNSEETQNLLEEKTKKEDGKPPIPKETNTSQTDLLSQDQIAELLSAFQTTDKKEIDKTSWEYRLIRLHESIFNLQLAPHFSRWMKPYRFMDSADQPVKASIYMFHQGVSLLSMDQLNTWISESHYFSSISTLARQGSIVIALTPSLIDSLIQILCGGIYDGSATKKLCTPTAMEKSLLYTFSTKIADALRIRWDMLYNISFKNTLHPLLADQIVLLCSQETPMIAAKIEIRIEEQPLGFLHLLYTSDIRDPLQWNDDKESSKVIA